MNFHIIMLYCAAVYCLCSTVVYSQSKSTAVARVLQTSLTAKDLEPDIKLKAEAEKALTVAKYKEWTTNVKYVNLATKIMEPLQAQALKEKNISISASEVDSFFDYSQKAREVQKQQAQSLLQNINSQLSSGKLSGQEKEQANAYKKQIEQQMTVLNQPMPKPTQREREMADKIIRAWKFDQMVYNQYGGVVLASQTGPQPMGAYKKFLEDHQKKNSFEILDKSYQKKFWEVFSQGKNSTVVPNDKVNFSKPWWVQLVEQAGKK